MLNPSLPLIVTRHSTVIGGVRYSGFPSASQPVVLGVDDADVLELEMFDAGQLVFGFAEPAAVVVESDRAAEFVRFLGDGADGFRGGFDLVLVFLAAGVAHRDPELRFYTVLLDD